MSLIPTLIIIGALTVGICFNVWYLIAERRLREGSK